jgi:ubiquinone/menaquinone biosynthesis C-methylase UbiE
MSSDPRELQRRYYAQTADRYESMHVRPGDEHYVALRYISSFVESLDLDSVLDVGCGTGRGVRHLLEQHPSIRVAGVEPVPELIGQAVEVHGIPEGAIAQGLGESLPFADDSFDAVCELGMLHHVPNPDAVVAEMMRVARRAVFLSDENTFGWGTRKSRLTKLVLYKTGMFPIAEWVKTRGRGFRVTEDDGIAYSYSVYRNLRALSDWAERLALIPTVPCASGSWMHPLLTASHLLVAALRDDSPLPRPLGV